MVAQKGRRREWLRDAGVALALVLAAAALGLALIGGSECEGSATPPGGEPATHAEVEALNSTLAAASVGVERRLHSVETRATELCDALYKSKAITLSMEVVQEVDTSGAADWEAFTLNGTTYLAVANTNLCNVQPCQMGKAGKSCFA
jgi:hypothetical protein